VDQTPPDVMINTCTVAHQGRWGVHSITVSSLFWGTRGRRFKSSRSDH
jgi:hypothetical protein